MGEECRYFGGVLVCSAALFWINLLGVFMRRIKHWQILAMVVGMGGWIVNVGAVDYGNLTVPAGTTKVVNQDDTMTSFMVRGQMDNYSSFPSYLGTGADEYGNGPNGVYAGGTINNFGNLVVNSNGLDSYGGKIVNKPNASIVLINQGYIDMYGTGTSVFENEGNLSVLNGGFLTAGVMRGTFKNSGRIYMDTPQRGCSNGSAILLFQNLGTFEIAADSICDFGNNPMTTRNKTNYSQNNGLIKVNGVFGAHVMQFFAGELSGKGTVRGGFLGDSLWGVTVAPGDPVGTLTLAPTSGQLACQGCTINIDVAGNKSGDYSQLNVVGHLDIDPWVLNVRLRGNYVPTVGARFVIVTASNGVIELIPEENRISLPALPNNRTWSVVNEGNQIVLIAN